MLYVSAVKDELDPEHCIDCDGGDHYTLQTFIDYATPMNLVMAMEDEVDWNVDGYPQDYDYGDPKTQDLALIYRAITTGKPGNIEYRRIAEDADLV